MKMNMTALILTRKRRSKIRNGATCTGLITAATPKTMKILNTFDPIILPTATSRFFFRKATSEVMISGRLVPIEIMVAEIRNSLHPHVCAIDTTESTVNLPPTYSPSIERSIIRKL